MNSLRAVVLACAAATQAVSSSPAFAFGEPDTSAAVTTLAGWTCTGHLAAAAHGDVYVLATIFNQGNLAVFRVKADGSLDASWGTNGRADLPAGAFVNEVAPLIDGSVLLVGRTVMKLDASGHVDLAYGGNGNGRAFDNFVAPDSFATLPDGGIILQTVHGVSNGNGTSTPTNAFVRLRPDGRQDTSFGRGGYIDIPTGDAPYAWSVMADGTYEVGRYRQGPGNTLSLQLHQGPGDFLQPARIIPQAGIARWIAPWVNVDAAGRVYFAVGGAAPMPGDAAQKPEIDVLRFGYSAIRDTAFNASLPVPYSAGAPTIVSPKALWRSASGAWNVVARVDTFSGGDAIIPVAPASLSTRLARFTSDGVPDPAFAQLMTIDSPNSWKVARLASGALVQTTDAGGCSVQHLAADAPAEGKMVEYTVPGQDRYFMALEGSETTLLDTTPAGNGWKRTGYQFGAWSVNDLPDATKLCRFYGDAQAGPNSHFYTPQGAECDSLRALDAATPAGKPAWRFEGYGATVALVDAMGNCPINLTPVHRLYNRGFERGGVPNHRYTIDTQVYESMQASGWVGEGIAFCVPPVANDVSTLR